MNSHIKKLSIVIPSFNEEKTISEILRRVQDVKLPGIEKEIIFVDDGSTDKTLEIVKKVVKDSRRIRLIEHEKNQGKGAAVRTGIENATGDYIIIQDADLEYDPQYIPMLLSHINDKKDVVYGTRLKRLPHLGKEEKTLRFLTHYFGNRFLSLITSVMYGQWLTDMETCYKLFPREQVKTMKLKSRRFDFEPEITAKLLKKGLKIKEISIETIPRGYDEGKKLNTIRDGFVALWTLVKYRFVS